MRLSNLLLILILVCAVLAAVSTFRGESFKAQPADEICYLKYISYIGQAGISGYPLLFKEYVENSALWHLPNPLRIGFILLAWLWAKFFGATFNSIAYLSLFSYALFLIVCFHFIRKYFDDATALFTTILLAFSPINLAMSRRILIESTLNLFLVLSIWVFFDMLQKRSNIKYLLFIIVYVFAILIKETAALFSLVFAAFLLIRKFLLKKDVYFSEFALATFFPLLIVAAVYASLGGLQYAPQIIKLILVSVKTNNYAMHFGSGPWSRYFVDFLLLSPVILILFVGFVFYYLMRKKYDEIIIYWLVIFIAFLFSLSFLTKNIRYAMILDVPMRLFSCLALIELSKKFFGRNALKMAVVFIIAIAILDYINFYQIFIYRAVYDPMSYLLLMAKGII